MERERGPLPTARWALAALSALAWMGACLDSTAPPPTVATLTVSPFTAAIDVGDTLRLTATLRDQAGVAIRGHPVDWASGAPDVATVSPGGLVTGMADGLVTITAASGGAYGRALVTVGGPPAPAPQLVASNAVSPPQGTLRAAGPPGVSALSGDEGDSIAFVSLSPGAAPSGVTATVHSPAASQSLTAVMSNGGFDPVAIGARPGDSIRVVVRDGQGVILLQAQITVAAARPPIVVRTDPPPRKRDVPLNTAIMIVFSEPMDEATLTPTSVLLLRGSTSVGGAVRLLDAAGLTGVFEPSGALAPNTDYRLVVTSAVRDLDGTALEAPAATDFTTGDAVTGGAASVTVSPSLIEGFFPLTTLIRAYVRDAQGNVLAGAAVQWTSSDSSVATITPSGGEAWVTLRAGGTATITATSEGLKDTAVVRSYPFPPGSVRLTTVTTGEDLDPNGYLATVSYSGGNVIPINGSLLISGASPGEHAVELTDVASNCAVSGPNPQTVTVVSFDTAEVGFAVTCSGGLPSLRVTIATTGAALDPDGYMAYVSGWAFGGAYINGSITYAGITPGERAVELRDVASNCAVTEPNPQVVTIVRGATAEVAFNVTCVAGTVRVTAATTGVELDPDGYVAQIGGDRQPLPVDGTVTYSSVAPGDHPVALTDVAGNCAVAGANPRTVTVTAGATTDVAFEVACTAGTASIRVTTATTGLGLDPDGYTVSVDGAPEQALADGGTLTVAGLSAGDHIVSLSGVAANCAVNGANPLTTSVAASSTAAVVFAVGCVARLESVAAGNGYSCGLISDGAAYCWGENYYGQLGDSTSKNWRPTPVRVVGGLAFASLAPGANHTCGLTPAGEAYCCGQNYFGELGDGTRTDRLAPVLVSGGLTFAALDAAWDETCGLTPSGRAYCWGRDGTATPTPVPGGLTFVALAIGDSFCGLTPEGAAYCAFGNIYTQALAVSGGLTFITLAPGFNFTCGLMASGAAYCWGFNNKGQLGNDTTAGGWAPVPVIGGLTFAALATGGVGEQACALTSAGAAYCWGDNAFGQLGNGTTIGGPQPVAVAGGLAFVQLSTGWGHTCGLATDRAVYCWGHYGGLGDGTTVDSAVPVKVAGQP